ASILVLMEVGLMLGRMINLVPTIIFIAEENYFSYFSLLGTFILLNIPFLVYGKHVEKEVLAKK
ncbi:MAG: hypothetical protein QXZ47_04095, partial [Candidatus Bathyarchaeia archaeon]